MGRNDYVQARKQYVDEVRRSFQQQEEPDEFEDELQETGSASFFKVRLLISVCIFVAFLLCDRTGSRFYHYTTDEIISMMQEEPFQAQLESIRETWNTVTNKVRKDSNEKTSAK